MNSSFSLKSLLQTIYARLKRRTTPRSRHTDASKSTQPPLPRAHHTPSQTSDLFEHTTIMRPDQAQELFAALKGKQPNHRPHTEIPPANKPLSSPTAPRVAEPYPVSNRESSHDETLIRDRPSLLAAESVIENTTPKTTPRNTRTAKPRRFFIPRIPALSRSSNKKPLKQKKRGIRLDLVRNGLDGIATCILLILTLPLALFSPYDPDSLQLFGMLPHDWQLRVSFALTLYLGLSWLLTTALSRGIRLMMIIPLIYPLTIWGYALREHADVLQLFFRLAPFEKFPPLFFQPLHLMFMGWLPIAIVSLTIGIGKRLMRHSNKEPTKGRPLKSTLVFHLAALLFLMSLIKAYDLPIPLIRNTVAAPDTFYSAKHLSNTLRDTQTPGTSDHASLDLTLHLKGKTPTAYTLPLNMAHYLTFSEPNEATVYLAIRKPWGQWAPFYATRDFSFTLNGDPTQAVGQWLKPNPTPKTIYIVIALNPKDPETLRNTLATIDDLIDFKAPMDRIELIFLGTDEKPLTLTHRSTTALHTRLSRVRYPEIFSPGRMSTDLTALFQSLSTQKQARDVVLTLITTEPLIARQETEAALTTFLERKTNRFALFSFTEGMTLKATSKLRTQKNLFLSEIDPKNRDHSFSQDFRAWIAILYRNYVFRLTSGTLLHNAVWIAPTNGIAPDQSTHVSVDIPKNLEGKIKKAEFIIDDTPLSTLTLSGQTRLTFPLHPLSVGSHVFSLRLITETHTAYETRRTLVVKTPKRGLSILSPSFGDSVSERVLIQATLNEPLNEDPPQENALIIPQDGNSLQETVSFYANSTPIGTAHDLPFALYFNVPPEETSTLTLEAKATFSSGEIVTDSVRVKPNARYTLTFERPSFGEFVTHPMTIALLLTPVNSGDDSTQTEQTIAQNVQSVRYDLDGAPIAVDTGLDVLHASFKIPDDLIGTHTLRALATLTDGTQLSTATSFHIAYTDLVIKGVGTSTALFTAPTIRIVWDSSKNFAFTDTLARFKALKQSLFRALDHMPREIPLDLINVGGKRVESHNGCQDFSLIPNVSRSDFETAILATIPKGDAPILAATQRAFEKLPQDKAARLLLIAGGKDNCERLSGSTLALLKKAAKRSKNTSIRILVPHHLDENQRTFFETLANTLDGHVMFLDGTQTLQSVIEDALSYPLELRDLEGHVAWSGSLKPRTLSLKAGTYQYRIGDDAHSETGTVILKNAQPKNLIVSPNLNKTPPFDITFQ